MFDTIIIGGGPAGLTAGIFSAREGLKTLIIERESIGGQIVSSPLVENYPGYEKISGSELIDKMYEQVTDLGVDIELSEVKEIIPGSIFKVITEDSTYETKTIILATGAKYRKLGIPHEDNLIGKGIHFCTTCDGPFYKDKIVAVIGGANSAVINAIYLASIAKKVYLIYRKDKLRCEEVLKKQIENTPNVEIIYNSNVTKLIGENELKKIELNNEKELEINGMFLAIGLDAETELAKKLINTDEHGYYLSNESITNIPGLFVAGDVVSKSIRQLTTATNDGTIAAINAYKYIKNLEN